MKKALLSLPLVLSASAASAGQSGVGYGGTTGALAIETRGLATTPDEVRRQGGFATAGAVHWTGTPRAHQKMSAVAY